MINKFPVFICTSAKKSLSKISLSWKERITKAVNLLEYNPYAGDKMAGRLANCRKIRIWPYCIIYQVNKREKIIKILEIEHRGNVSYS